MKIYYICLFLILLGFECQANWFYRKVQIAASGLTSLQEYPGVKSHPLCTLLAIAHDRYSYWLDSNTGNCNLGHADLAAQGEEQIVFIRDLITKMLLVQSGTQATSKSEVTALLPNGQICPMFDPPEARSTKGSNFAELEGWIYKCGGNWIDSGRITRCFKLNYKMDGVLEWVNMPSMPQNTAMVRSGMYTYSDGKGKKVLVNIPCTTCSSGPLVFDIIKNTWSKAPAPIKPATACSAGVVDGYHLYQVMGDQCGAGTPMSRRVQVWDMRDMTKQSVLLEHNFPQGVANHACGMTTLDQGRGRGILCAGGVSAGKRNNVQFMPVEGVKSLAHGISLAPLPVKMNNLKMGTYGNGELVIYHGSGESSYVDKTFRFDLSQEKFVEVEGANPFEGVNLGHISNSQRLKEICWKYLISRESGNCNLGNADLSALGDEQVVFLRDLTQMMLVQGGMGSPSASAISALLPNGKFCPMFDPPESRSTYFAELAELDGWIYKCGGKYTDGGNINKCSKLNFDTDSDLEWMPISSTPRLTTLIRSGMIPYSDGKGKKVLVAFPCGTCTSGPFVYDIIKDSWSTAPEPARPATGCSATAVDGPYLYQVMGDQCGAGTPNSRKAQVWDMRDMNKGSVLLEHNFPLGVAKQACGITTLDGGRGKGILCAGGIQGGVKSIVQFMPVDGPKSLGNGISLSPLPEGMDYVKMATFGNGEFVIYHGFGLHNANLDTRLRFDISQEKFVEVEGSKSFRHANLGPISNSQKLRELCWKYL